MERTLREHLRRLGEHLEWLSQEIMEKRNREERNKIEAEIRAANLAITHYKAALELEQKLTPIEKDT
jgi:hypothetical protein